MPVHHLRGTLRQIVIHLPLRINKDFCVCVCSRVTKHRTRSNRSYAELLNQDSKIGTYGLILKRRMLVSWP